MKVLLVVGSMRERSTTRRALAVAAEGVEEAGGTVEWALLRDLGLPIHDGRSDPETLGPEATEWIRMVGEADAFLVGSPEYNGSMTGALKNALDLAPSEVVRGKMAGLVAVARGDAGAMNTLNHLRHVLRWVGAWVLPTQVSIPRASLAFDEQGAVVRTGLEDELRLLGRELVRYSRLLAGNPHR